MGQLTRTRKLLVRYLPPVNRVARLLAAEHGGQILLSLATQKLVRDHLPEQVELCDMERPSQQSARSNHNLYRTGNRNRGCGRDADPVGRTPADAHRPGRFRKNALELAGRRRSGGRFHTWVGVVALAPISDPAHVIPAIAQTLGVRVIDEHRAAEGNPLQHHPGDRVPAVPPTTRSSLSVVTLFWRIRGDPGRLLGALNARR